jgi:hypothetical protein
MAKRKTERERQAEAKKVTGQFTGSYAINPFTKSEFPFGLASTCLQVTELVQLWLFRHTIAATLFLPKPSVCP